MYNSPVSIFEPEQTICERIAKDTEEYIYKAVLSQNIVVNRDELIKALQYDRDQYNKGYHDAMLKLKREWISAKDRLPEKYIPFLAVFSNKDLPEKVYVVQRTNDGYWSFQNGYVNFVLWKNVELKYWMPMPEPPKENEYIKRICKNCKYFRDMKYYCCCWGQKDAPRVEPEGSCESWKPKEE